jgi:hypothetical protein
MTNYATNLVENLELLDPPSDLPWVWLVAALLVLAVVGVLFWRRLRQKPETKGVSPATAEDAVATALEALRRIRPMIAPERSREFAIEVTSVLRQFLEQRFGLLAPQRATEEFLRESAEAPDLDARLRDLLGNFLRTCDVLKFGRAEGEKAELEAMHDAAVRFVEASRPRRSQTGGRH